MTDDKMDTADMTLPPLPDDPEGSMEVDLGPNWHNGQIAPGRVVGYLDDYSAKQMHEYATAAVLAEREAWQADAARYRWLRNQKESLYYLIPGAREAMGFVDLADMPQFDELDAAIDTVMRQERPDHIPTGGKMVGIAGEGPT